MGHHFVSPSSALALATSYCLFILCYLLLSPNFLIGQTLAEKVGVNLNDLSDAELEAICTDRGFELVRETDDGTNEPYIYTHDDYVDAARQCLEIEEEMEQLLQENPEILQDLEAETKRMMEEKERLEKELADAQNKLDKDREDAKKKFTSAFIPNDDKEEDGSNGASEEESSATVESSFESGGEDTNETIIDLDGAEDEKVANSAGEDKVLGNQNDAVDETTADDDGSGGKESEQTSDTKKKKSSSTDGKESSLALKKLTRDVIKEFRERTQQDMRWLADVIFPKPAREPVRKALRPLARIARDAGISVFDLIKRHLRAIFQSAGNQRREERGNEKSENTEKAPQRAR